MNSQYTNFYFGQENKKLPAIQKKKLAEKFPVLKKRTQYGAV
jgi:hypothetical protein